MNKENKRSERKTVLIFCLFIICGGAVGFVLGFFSERINYDVIAAAVKSNMSVIAKALLAVFALETVVFSVLSLIKYRQAKKAASLAEDDEELYEDAGNRISSAILISNLATVFAFVLIGAVGWIIVFSDIDTTLKKVMLFSSFPIFLFELLWALFIQRAAVNLSKRINPEKRGSIFDFRFDKKWEESCDEGELGAMYEAGYRAFMFTTKLCYLLYFITVVSMFVFHTGVFPVICVGVVHFALMVSNYHAIKKHR